MGVEGKEDLSEGIVVKLQEWLLVDISPGFWQSGDSC